MPLGSFDRTRNLDALARTPVDVLVVGGGVTGAGVALDAASRGLRTALVERDDFASGTSSKSSKLVHGGLRYLQNGDVRLVYEALRERQRLLRNAPHLVRLLPFLIPITGKGGVVNPKIARALGSAMWMYDLTGGARIGKLHKRLGKDEALAHMPTLRADRLASGYLYYDAAADDARLTLALARTAALDHGAVVANHARVVELVKDGGGRIRGAVVEAADPADPAGGTRRIEISARAVVNATGVWADDLASLDAGEPVETIRPAKGIHLTLPWERVRNDIAVVVPVPGDKRSVFVVPWVPDGRGGYRFTYVGTTDTDHDGSLDDPTCTPEDVAYLLGAINHSLDRSAGEPLGEDDVLGTWAGLRPLVSEAGSGRTADLSRRHRVTLAESGLATVTGGKLTTYREMAEDTVDAVVEHLGDLPRSAKRSGTRRLALRGAAGWAEAAERSPHLAERHGGEAAVIEAMIHRDPALGEPLVPGLPYLRAEVLHAVRHEMAITIDDVLARRTRARLQLRDASAGVADEVAALIGPELGWSEEQAQRQVEAYRASVEAERTAPGLPEAALPPLAPSA
jgi:glycerol-3-phosphate dehydrogenase